MRLLLELFGTWPSMLVMHCVLLRKVEFLLLFIFVPHQVRRWQGSWLHWHWHTCLMEGEYLCCLLCFASFCYSVLLYLSFDVFLNLPYQSTAYLVIKEIVGKFALLHSNFDGKGNLRWCHQPALVLFCFMLTHFFLSLLTK